MTISLYKKNKDIINRMVNNIGKENLDFVVSISNYRFNFKVDDSNIFPFGYYMNCNINKRNLVVTESKDTVYVCVDLSTLKPERVSLYPDFDIASARSSIFNALAKSIPSSEFTDAGYSSDDISKYMSKHYWSFSSEEAEKRKEMIINTKYFSKLSVLYSKMDLNAEFKVVRKIDQFPNIDNEDLLPVYWIDFKNNVGKFFKGFTTKYTRGVQNIYGIYTDNFSMFCVNSGLCKIKLLNSGVLDQGYVDIN